MLLHSANGKSLNEELCCLYNLLCKSSVVCMSETVVGRILFEVFMGLFFHTGNKHTLQPY